MGRFNLLFEDLLDGTAGSDGWTNVGSSLGRKRVLVKNLSVARVEEVHR
jgi:hypothetical protein